MAKTTGILENDGGGGAAMVIKVMEWKKELRKLVNAIIDEENCLLETYDRANETVLALKDCKFKKSQPQSLVKIDALEVPQHFLCPISNELMKDPVIVATGQTYERQFIQSWLESGYRVCPQTQQVLSHTSLIPNNLVREMISQWCKNQGIELPNPVHSAHLQGITKGEKDRFDTLLKTVVSSSLPEQKQAAKELRSLTKRMPSFRTLFGEKRDAIPKLLVPLSMGKAYCPPDLQEDLVTTVLNLSILDENKKLVAETTEAIPLLIDSLKDGTIDTRRNAAAALFSLSALDSNKSIIGLSGALKPLIDLLEEGHTLAMKDAASAIFNLCITHENKQRAVRDGAVKVILQKIMDRIYVDELLAILAILTGHEKGVEEMTALGAVSCLLSIIKESNSGRNGENSIAILYSICTNDRSKLRDIREEERANRTISKLSQNGTSRARRKANAILEKLNRTGLLTYTA